MRQRSWQGGRFDFRIFGLLLLLLAAGRGAAFPAQSLNVSVLRAPVPSASSLFGYAVRISGDGRTALVGAPAGAPCPSTPEATCGAVYVYSRSPAGWSLEATLAPGDGGYPGFGAAIALSPDAKVALVGGASAKCPDSATVPCGLLYVFANGGGGSWTQEARIVSPAVSDRYRDGISLALSEGGATALVAASPQSCAGGAGVGCAVVQVYQRNAGAWNLSNILIPDFNTRSTFTVALSRDGGRALVGIPDGYRCLPGSDCGAKLFVYENPAVPNATFSWSELITTSSPTTSRGLGNSIGLSGDGELALAGDPAHLCEDHPASTCAAGFVFRRTGGAWAEERRFLPAADSPLAYSFGARAALSLDGSTAVFEAVSPGCQACADLFLAQRLDGDWSGPLPLAASVPGAVPVEPSSIQPLTVSGDGKTVLLGTPWTSCAAGQSCGSVQVYEGIARGVAVGIPVLDRTGLALLALLLAASGWLLLLRRRPGA